MLHWQFITRFNQLNPPIDIKFGRKDCDEEQYMNHCQQLKQSGIKVEEYIKQNVLKGNNVVYTNNRFPYDLDTGIKHDLIWIQPGHHISIQEVERIIRENNPNICLEKQCVYFKNVPKNQSIRAIEHYQVFININTPNKL